MGVTDRRNHDLREPETGVHIPTWVQSPFGLVLPNREPQTPVLPTPPELRSKPDPVVVERDPPSPLSQLLPYIDEDAVGFLHSSFDDIVENARSLPCIGSLAAIASLMARVRQLGFAATQQLEVAEDFYGKGPLLAELRVLVREQPRRRVFAEQQLMLALWVLITNAAPEGPPRELRREEYGTMRRMTLGCTSVVGDMSRMIVGESRDTWVWYLMQMSAVYRHEMPFPAIARAQELLRRALNDSAREDEQFCPIDEWHMEIYGVALEEQLRLGFALSTLAHAWDQHRDAGRNVYVTPEVVDDALCRTGLRGRRDVALALISATREEFVAQVRTSEQDARRALWDQSTFQRFPFFRCADGGLILLSPYYLQSWLTDGFHFRSLSAAKELDRMTPMPKGQRSQRYQNFRGRLYENYCLGLARSVHARKGPQAARVLGEQPFNASRRKKNGKGEKTSDIAIDIRPDLILVETTASRQSLDGLRTGDPARLMEDLDRTVIAKIRQLDNCINHLLAGRAELPGLPAAAIERVWPVVVSFGVVQQNPALWDHIDEEARGALQQARVMPLTLLDPEEWELLCGLVEAERPLPELLALKTAEPYARMDFAYWLTRDPRAPREKNRARLLKASFDRAMRDTLAGIDFDAGERAD